MRNTFLDSNDDMQWLADVHGITEALCCPVALLIGNEDCPDEIWVYTVNHWKAHPIKYTLNANMKYDRMEY